MKIVVVTPTYPPAGGVAARRWQLLVRELRCMGVNCTVITSGGTGRFGAETEDDESILRVPLIKDGTRTSTVRRRSRVTEGFRNGLFWAKPNLLDSSVYSWMKGVHRVWPRLLLVVRDADFLISSYGPAGPLLAGWWMSRKTGTPWVADLRDTFEARDGVTGRFGRSLSRRSEWWLLNQAVLRLTVGQRLAEYLASRYRLGFTAIYNGWVATDRISPTRRVDCSSRYLLYGGTLYDHRIPALKMLLEAMSTVPDLRLRIRLVRDISGRLTDLIRQEKSPTLVDILPATDEATLRTELSDARAAVVLEDIESREPWSPGTVTGKLLPLLASGKGGVAIASPTSELCQLTSRVDGWHCVHSVEGCRKVLLQVLSRDTQTNGPEVLTEFRVAKQAEALARELRRCLCER